MENPHAPQKDDALVVTRYRRTPQQAAMLGLEVTGSCCRRAWGSRAGQSPRSLGDPELRRSCCFWSPLLQGEELDEKPADSVEDLRNEVGDPPVRWRPGQAPRTGALGWPGLSDSPFRSCDPGPAVQHQLPRVQRSSEHKHEVSAYPLRGGMGADRCPLQGSAWRLAGGGRVALCAADPAPFPLHPRSTKELFLVGPLRVQISLGAAHSLLASSCNTSGRTEAVKRARAAALRLSFR